MSIRNRLTWLFVGVVAVLLLLVLTLVFVLERNASQREFRQRLRERAQVTAYVYLEKDEMRAEAFRTFERKYLEVLSNEILQVYDDQGKVRFVAADARVRLSDVVLARIVTGREVYFELGEREAVGLFYPDNQGDFIIVAAAENALGRQRLQTLASIMAAIYVGSLLVLYGLGRVFAGRALAPIAALNDQVDRITALDPHQRVRVRALRTSPRDELTRLAQRTATNTEQLYKTNFASQSDLVAAREGLAKARANLSRTEQIVKLYGANTGSGAGGGAQPVYSVKAPVSGFVVERNVNPGMQLRPDNGTTLFTISDLSRVWVLLNVYETDVAALRMGQAVSITALAYPDKTFWGTVTNISNVVDPDTRVVQARVELPNPGNLLKPDMFCTVGLDLRNATTTKSLAVNAKAIIFNNDNYYVIRLVSGKGAGAKYEIVPVKVLRSTPSTAFVAGKLAASLGLLPAALSHGISSETQKPLAIVVIGGLISATLLSLLILPTAFEWVYSSRQERARHR